MLKNIFIAFILITSGLSARHIIPTPYPDQKEIYQRGDCSLVSNKGNYVSIANQTGRLGRNRTVYSFCVQNNTAEMFNLCFGNIKVTDQWGRPLRITHKRQIYERKRSARNFDMFAASIGGGLDAMNANRAGRLCYESHTFGPCGRQSTYGVAYSEGLRRQALYQAQARTDYNLHCIDAQFQNAACNLQDFYFDSTTIYPGYSYMANFQVEYPDRIARDLEYMYVTFELGGECHTFCFYCTPY